jgi:hypothetical protein
MISAGFCRIFLTFVTMVETQAPLAVEGMSAAQPKECSLDVLKLE